MQRRHPLSMLRGASEPSIQCHVIGTTQPLAQFHNKAHLPQTVQYLSPLLAQRAIGGVGSVAAGRDQQKGREVPGS